MIVVLTSAYYVGVVPAKSCKCCCKGPVVSLRSTAILTASGSVDPLSRSNLVSSNSHVANDSSKFLLSNVGLRSLVR